MRALLIVLNGAGAGPAPDAAKYGDEAADTLGHLFEHCPDLELPALFSLGLGEILRIGARTSPAASHGRMRPRSAGKDTTLAHWEIAGIISQESFATYDRFPDTLVREIETAAKVGFIANDARTNGALPEPLAREHLETGRPILAALPDSVMQISAHEDALPRARLYEIARAARRHCTTHRINRVVAQPLTGPAGDFTPAPALREYPTIPPRTVLNAISETGLHVDGIGNVGAFFAHSGITRHHAARSNEEVLEAIDGVWDEHLEGLVFASLGGLGVHGRVRKLRGFAEALHRFDGWLAGFLGRIDPDDLLIITADQGCDPTFPGAGYTREEAPLLVKYDNKAESLGIRLTFSDVAATLAACFHLREPWRTGAPFFKFPRPGHLSRR
jgi:phosphopentomutase